MGSMVSLNSRHQVKSVLLGCLFYVGALGVQRAENLTSKVAFIRQSWAQETDYPRPYHVFMPEKAQSKPLKLILFLHGNGGTPLGAKKQFFRQFPHFAQHYACVFPEGYAKSWNIVSEASKADDLAFIESIIQRLLQYDNVVKTHVTVIGSSNGAAMVNQLAIESQMPQIKNLVTLVSPLNEFQHDGAFFRKRGPNNGYTEAAQPLRGRRLMNVSGAMDRLVPYDGGPSSRIPAKGGRLAFLPAETSTFLWAQCMGFEGNSPQESMDANASMELFRYLNGDIIHIKIPDKGHNAGSFLTEKTLRDFLGGSNE